MFAHHFVEFYYKRVHYFTLTIILTLTINN